MPRPVDPIDEPDDAKAGTPITSAPTSVTEMIAAAVRHAIASLLCFLPVIVASRF
jgi:hypothetical protein